MWIWRALGWAHYKDCFLFGTLLNLKPVTGGHANVLPSLLSLVLFSHMCCLMLYIPLCCIQISHAGYCTFWSGIFTMNMPTPDNALSLIDWAFLSKNNNCALFLLLKPNDVQHVQTAPPPDRLHPRLTDTRILTRPATTNTHLVFSYSLTSLF